MATGSASVTESILERMRAVLEELDAHSYSLAAAYLAQAISVVEDQVAEDRESRV